MDVDFGRGFKKQYKKLPGKIREKFDAQLSLFQRDPYNRLLGRHKLHGDKKHLFSIDVTGDYRALFKQENRNRVVFREIGTHSQLYG